MTILTNYQWAKSIDDTSQNKVNGVSRTVSQQFDKGLAEFHRSHVFNFSGLWDIPGLPKQGVPRLFFGGWSLTGIASLYSGQPFTVGSGVDNARTGIGGQRADLIGDPNFSGNRKRQEVVTEYLRKAAFATNPLGTYGNLGRNTFFNPGLANVDLGLAKNFKWNERVNTFFRFEAFNAFNRVNLNGPSAAQNSATFMRITGAQDPRILQLALRMTF